MYKRIWFISSLGRREIVTYLNGGAISSDGGALLLREVEQRTNVFQRFAQCFTDYRDQNRIEYSVLTLVSQRVFGLALGYEDLNDHDQLASDKKERDSGKLSIIDRPAVLHPHQQPKSELHLQAKG